MPESIISTFSRHGVRAAIVDLDGTLVDTLGDFDVALNATLRELGLRAVDAETIRHMVGKGSEHLVRSVLAHVHADPGHYEAAWASYQRNYLAVNGDHASVYPGVPEGLRAMREAGWTLACLTNKPLGFARPLLARTGLLDDFACVFGGDSFERKKPDPLPLLRTCEALATTPARTLMVGDSSNDAAAARAAGCPVLLVTYGYNHGQPARDVDADAWVDSFAELALS